MPKQLRKAPSKRGAAGAILRPNGGDRRPKLPSTTRESPGTKRPSGRPARPEQAESGPESIFPAHTRKIKDPLYGYIYLSELEYKLIQHPLLLRLHHVRQNSSVYLTYPSAHGTRFSHSLGTMHLAGTIIARALRVASPEAIHALRAVLSRVCEGKEEGWNALFDKLSSTESPPALNADGLYAMQNLVPVRSEEQLARLLLFQSVMECPRSSGHRL